MKCPMSTTPRAYQYHWLPPRDTSLLSQLRYFLQPRLYQNPTKTEAASELASITMAGAQFLTLLRSSSRSSLFKPSRPFFYNPIKNYGEASKGKQSRLMEERAPSIAEEFERVAEEKAGQVVASQTVDKTYDGAEEATKGNSRNETVKDRYKEQEPGSDYHRRGN